MWNFPGNSMYVNAIKLLWRNSQVNGIKINDFVVAVQRLVGINFNIPHYGKVIPQWSAFDEAILVLSVLRSHINE